MAYQTVIKIVVQDLNERASFFADRLTKMCKELSKQYNLQPTPARISFMTTSSDGRQTATIQFITDTNYPKKNEGI